MSNIQTMRKAIALFKNPLIPKSQQRHNQRQWLRSVGMLGKNWILAQPVTKRPVPYGGPIIH